MKGDWRSVGVRLVKSYTGYDANSGKFNFAYLWNGVAPLAAGFIVHWIAGKLGVNKVLARSKVPVIRI
jgi:glycerol uptake facilitator-like aquaporin